MQLLLALMAQAALVFSEDALTPLHDPQDRTVQPPEFAFMYNGVAVGVDDEIVACTSWDQSSCTAWQRGRLSAIHFMPSNGDETPGTVQIEVAPQHAKKRAKNWILDPSKWMSAVHSADATCLRYVGALHR